MITKERKEKAEKIVSALMSEFKRIRKEKKLSNEKLANMSGLHRTTIGLLENEKRVPTILTCLKISLALDKSLSDLIKITSEEETDDK